MTVRYTRLGCKVETTFIVCPNKSVQENIVLSTEPQLALEPNESAGTVLRPANLSKWDPCPRRYRK